MGDRPSSGNHTARPVPTADPWARSPAGRPSTPVGTRGQGVLGGCDVGPGDLLHAGPPGPSPEAAAIGVVALGQQLPQGPVDDDQGDGELAGLLGVPLPPPGRGLTLGAGPRARGLRGGLTPDGPPRGPLCKVSERVSEEPTWGTGLPQGRAPRTGRRDKPATGCGFTPGTRRQRGSGHQGLGGHRPEGGQRPAFRTAASREPRAGSTPWRGAKPACRRPRPK